MKAARTSIDIGALGESPAKFFDALDAVDHNDNHVPPTPKSTSSVGDGESGPVTIPGPDSPSTARIDDRTVELIAATLGTDFTGPRCMSWEERLATVRAVLDAVDAATLPVLGVDI